MQSNGVTLDNGEVSGTVVSEVQPTVSNGTCHDDGAIEGKHVLSPVKKQSSPLSQMETDILRLVGQHLREMGYP